MSLRRRTLENKIEQAMRGLNWKLITIVVDACEVERRSLDGYRLVEITHEDVVDYTHETVTTNEGGYQRQYPVSKPVMTHRARFVMVQNDNDLLAKKEIELTALKARLEKAEKSVAAELDKNKQQDKRISDLDGVKQRLDAQAREQEDTLQRWLEKNRKLEGDIGKIRTAIGDLRMKEIIG